MSSGPEQIESLVSRPRESLPVELKGWFDPETPQGIAKIARACIALRNQNGGYLLIGFADADGSPDIAAAPENVRSDFHADVVQGIVAKYASEAFEAHVHFVDREGATFPVVEVEPGVRTPVAAKRALDDPEGGRPLVRRDAVYVRSLESNNTVSTTEATWKDWPRIVEICFDNRDADVGRFIRRHLPNLTREDVRSFAESLQLGEPDPTGEERAQALLDRGFDRYNTELVRRSPDLPGFGTMEVAAVVNGALVLHVANESFLSLLDANNPNYTGWPVWVDSRGFREQDARPYVYGDGWEAFIWSAEPGLSSHLDFWRRDPGGEFYLLRALQDDLVQRIEPLKSLDFALVVLRVAEAIAVPLRFARAMLLSDADAETAEVAFAFRWTGLANRELSSWASPGRDISPGRICMQDRVSAEVVVPVETSPSALAGFVGNVVARVFAVFQGFELGDSVVEDLVERLLARRL
ncbi:MAG: RNA-binding domain-containing protein [Myxococcota bacterium]